MTPIHESWLDLGVKFACIYYLDRKYTGDTDIKSLKIVYSKIKKINKNIKLTKQKTWFFLINLLSNTFYCTLAFLPSVKVKGVRLCNISLYPYQKTYKMSADSLRMWKLWQRISSPPLLPDFLWTQGQLLTCLCQQDGGRKQNGRYNRYWLSTEVYGFFCNLI